MNSGDEDARELSEPFGRNGISGIWIYSVRNRLGGRSM